MCWALNYFKQVTLCIVKDMNFSWCVPFSFPHKSHIFIRFGGLVAIEGFIFVESIAIDFDITMNALGFKMASLIYAFVTISFFCGSLMLLSNVALARPEKGALNTYMRWWPTSHQESKGTFLYCSVFVCVCACLCLYMYD